MTNTLGSRSISSVKAWFKASRKVNIAIILKPQTQVIRQEHEHEFLLALVQETHQQK